MGQENGPTDREATNTTKDQTSVASKEGAAVFILVSKDRAGTTRMNQVEKSSPAGLKNGEALADR